MKLSRLSRHLTQLDYILIVVIILLAVSSLLFLASPAAPSSSNISGGGNIPVTSGGLNQPGDIQNPASGLQSAAPLAPNQLNQVKL